MKCDAVGIGNHVEAEVIEGIQKGEGSIAVGLAKQRVEITR